MNPRAGLFVVLALLVAGLAWWILDGGNPAGPLEGSGETPTEEVEVRAAAPETEAPERERSEEELAEADAGHGHAPPDFGDLVDAVGEAFRVEPKRAFRFSGRVVSAGAPVAGAEVVVSEGVSWGTVTDGPEELILTCDAAGRFSGEYEVRQNYSLALVARGYQLLAKDKLHLSPELEGVADDLELELFPATEFYGSVTVASGAMVEGATVTLELANYWSRNRAGNNLQTTYLPVSYEQQTTGPDGLFSWQVPSGDYQVRAKHDEYGEDGDWEVNPEECPVELQLEVRDKDPKTRIVGRVFGPDGRPKAGATVLFATNGPRTKTDANGEFVLQDAKKRWALEPEVLAWAKGCTPVAVPIPEMTELVGPLRIDLPRGGVLAGVVLDEDDQPVTFRTVTLMGLREFGDGSIPVSNELSLFGDEDEVQTDSEGRFRFESVPPKQLTVAVGNLYAPEASVLAFPDNDQLVLRMGELQGPSVTVQGRVIDAATGAPLPNVEVEVNKVSRSGTGGWSASSIRDLTTDENGMYRGEGLPPGEYYFEAILEGYARGKTAPVVEEAGEKTQDFALYPERTVRVVVRKADGTPAAGASVTILDATGQALMIWSGDGSGRTPARTDDSGVVVAHKMPGGPATIEVSHHSFEEVTRSVDWSGEGPHEVIIEIED